MKNVFIYVFFAILKRFRIVNDFFSLTLQRIMRTYEYMCAVFFGFLVERKAKQKHIFIILKLFYGECN